MITAPYVQDDGYVAEMPSHEFWIRSQDNVPRTVDEFIQALAGLPGHIDIACIGAAAVNQAIKVVAVARQRLAEKGLDVILQPFFSNILDDDDSRRTRMMLRATVKPL